MDRLFGTDGIRGVADTFPLDLSTVAAVGASLATRYAAKLGRPATLLTGRDTRESGERLEAALHAGAASAGALIESAGVITTPGVAFLTREFDFDAGIVVSASHNPYEDNGIKIFLPSGRKIDDATEREIESDIYGRSGGESVPTSGYTHAARAGEYQGVYAQHLASAFGDLDLSGVKMAVDCANGAACEFAPALFRKLGADVTAIHDRPDGRNINADCGSLHLDKVQAATRENQADIGVAFDGDSDRALFIDELGNIVDGDAVLWILGCLFQKQGALAGDVVVATVMSNIGLEIAFASRGIKLVRAAVGDKYVLEELLKTGSDLGGEQSGHIIVPSQSLVGDGIMTALFVLRAMRMSGKKLSELTAGFVRYPKILVKVMVKQTRPFDGLTDVAALSREIENELGGKGRLLLRYSGTENLARVMIEGEDQKTIESQASRLADAIRTSLG
jgi:phosphoglucosamine mutase